MKERWQKFLHWQHLGICLLVLVTLIMHFSIILIPDKVLFDEAFYVNDGNRIVSGQGTERTEHPPLGKFIVAAGIMLFGNNPFGWRFFSVVAGTVSLILFYFICRELAMPKIATLIASFILAFENISFVQSGVGMLDVFCVVFSMGTFYLYLRGKYLPAGIFAALSVLAKLNGALVLPVIGLHWLLARRDKPSYFIWSMIFTPVAFLIMLPIFNFTLAGKWVSPFLLTDVMLTATKSLTFANVTHEVRQFPWDWLFHRMNIAYWFKPDYSGTLSINLWALIIPTAFYLFIRSLWKNASAWFGLAWFIGLYVLWIPIVLITDRVTYGYYIYPTVGALCIGLALALTDILKLGTRFKQGKFKWVGFGVVAAGLLGHFGVFIFYSPVFTRWF